MKQHPLSAIFPAMPETEYIDLKAHIAEHGQQSAIAVFDGQVLDGWHRYRACGELGLKPKCRELTKGTDIEAFVGGQNDNRRHMSGSQRAMVRVKMAEWRQANRQKKGEPGSPLKTNSEMASAAKVSERTIQQAKIVAKEAPAATVQAVIDGKKSVKAAAAEVAAARQPKPSKSERPEPVRDATGYAIPEKLLPLWNRRGEVKEVLDAISRARSALRKVMEGMREGESDILYAPANVSGASAKLNDAWTTISMAMPYAVCPICQGRTPDSCKSCKGRGFVPKHTFEHAFPAELLAVREKSCVK